MATNKFGVYQESADTTPIKSSADATVSVIKAADLTLIETITTTKAFYTTGNTITFQLSITNAGDAATVYIKNDIASGKITANNYTIGSGGTPVDAPADTDLHDWIPAPSIDGSGAITDIYINGTIK